MNIYLGTTWRYQAEITIVYIQVYGSLEHGKNQRFEVNAIKKYEHLCIVLVHFVSHLPRIKNLKKSLLLVDLHL